MTPRALWLLRSIGLTLVALVGLIVLALLFAGEHLKHPIERLASHRLGVPVKIDGPLHVRLLSFTPAITAADVALGNPPWESRATLGTIERVHLEIRLLPLLRGHLVLQRLEMIRPELHLHRDLEGRANWTRASEAPTNAPSGPSLKLPVVRDLLIEQGLLTFTDEIRETKVRSSVEARQRLETGSARPLRLSGDGSFNGAPFTVRIAGAPLVHLEPGHSYPFEADVAAGDSRLRLEGALRRAFDFGTFEARVSASGQDIADLYHFLQVPIPNSPPYKIAFDLARDGKHVKVTGLAGTLGDSDISGAFDVDVSANRPVIDGELRSRRLLANDVGAFLGGQSAGSLGGKAAAQGPSGKQRLFPDAHLKVERMRMADADLRIHADALELANLPLKDVGLHLRLVGGFLSIDPLELHLPQGAVTGFVRVDAREQVPFTHIDLHLKDIELAQLHGKTANAAAPLSGHAQGRIQLAGEGDSVHRTVSSAQGTATLVVPHGQVNAAFAELTGIDVAEGLGLLLKGDNAHTEIRCGLAEFQVEHGVMQAQTFIVDTENVRITGRGAIRLGPEEIDLEIKGDPKKPRIGRVRAPILVSGPLLEPKIGVRVEGVVKQGAVAAALGAIVSPIAALLAFVDPGLAKDENCAALLSTPDAQKAAAPPGTPPSGGGER